MNSSRDRKKRPVVRKSRVHNSRGIGEEANLRGKFEIVLVD